MKYAHLIYMHENMYINTCMIIFTFKICMSTCTPHIYICMKIILIVVVDVYWEKDACGQYKKDSKMKTHAFMKYIYMCTPPYSSRPAT